MNCSNAFIGINAAGKTSVLKLIVFALNLLNNQPINHIETKDILGNTEKAMINIYFYSESREICKLETVITSEKTKTEVIYYRIIKERLWSKPQKSVTSKRI